MIAYLRGVILRKTDKIAVLDVQGVGYAVHVPAPFLMDLSVGEEAVLHIYTSVTENDIVLYGFGTPAERTLFEQLISVSGIGSKTALQILTSPIDQIHRAILTEDVASLKKFPGIGQKSAERLIIELKDKLQPIGALSRVTIRKVDTDALDALLALGFAKHEAARMLAEVPESVVKAEEMVQFALKQQKHT